MKISKIWLIYQPSERWMDDLCLKNLKKVQKTIFLTDKMVSKQENEQKLFGNKAKPSELFVLLFLNSKQQVFCSRFGIKQTKLQREHSIFCFMKVS